MDARRGLQRPPARSSRNALSRPGDALSASRDPRKTATAAPRDPLQHRGVSVVWSSGLGRRFRGRRGRVRAREPLVGRIGLGNAPSLAWLPRRLFAISRKPFRRSGGPPWRCVPLGRRRRLGAGVSRLIRRSATPSSRFSGGPTSTPRRLSSRPAAAHSLPPSSSDRTAGRGISWRETAPADAMRCFGLAMRFIRF